MSNLKYFKYCWTWYKKQCSGFLNAKKQPLRNCEDIAVFYRKQCTYNPQKTTGHVKKTAFRKADLQTPVYGEMKNGNYYSSTERYPRSILKFSTDTQKVALHPTQKPVALCEYMIRTYTNEGETVLDNCMGAGSTGVACVNTGRRFIGMELDQEYFDIAADRIAKAWREKQL